VERRTHARIVIEGAHRQPEAVRIVVEEAHQRRTAYATEGPNRAG
jgi:hypothetical protein